MGKLDRWSVACLVSLQMAVAGCDDGSGSVTPPRIDRPDTTAQDPEAQSFTRYLHWYCTERDCPSGGETIIMDGAPTSGAALGEGDLLLATGGTITIHENGATEIGPHSMFRQWSQVVGPVDSVDVDNARMVVMGQPIEILQVSINAPGFTASSALRELVPGDQVRVSGYRSQAGPVLATRIENVPASLPQRVIGYAREVDPAARSMHIADLSIDYGGALLELGGSGDPDGHIEVVGELGEDDPRSLRATEVRRHDPFGELQVGDRVEIEGIVDEASADRVSLYGLDVTLSENCTLDGVQAGNPVLVRGDVIAPRTISACPMWSPLSDTIVFPFGLDTASRRATGPVEQVVAGPIEEVDAERGLLWILGIRIQTTFATAIVASDVHGVIVPAALAPELVGSPATVSGFVGSEDAHLLAKRVHLANLLAPPIHARLIGMPTRADYPAIEIMGRSVRVDPDVTRYHDYCEETTLADYFDTPLVIVDLGLVEDGGEWMVENMTAYFDDWRDCYGWDY